ncbi:MAG TPA: 3-methyl-2-oxobutanoate hydroxymethyltransferase [Blastocatellia bacterium]|jgi:3-methyl-2-oxobutanoate hydroxymethyltransferase|nr:3-methyl-2-oxobutanoate hydroxymethyltransferase [Blastocatellia bacterium]
MSQIPEDDARRVTVPQIRARKGAAPITAVTAYDYPSARLADEAGFDIVLVGDSLAQTALGYATTLPVTLEEMIAATRAVRRGANRALIIGDMPFGYYQDSTRRAVESAIRFVKEGGADAVKIEGGSRRSHLAKAIVDAEIPLMGHIGLTPQSVLRMGGYKVQGKTMEAARELIEDALALERAGAFSLVLEGIPTEISRIITERIHIPTIGIGAGVECDGQILVFTDAVGLTFGHKPKFVRQYADVKGVIADALKQFADDISARRFPADAESYHLPEGTVVEIEDEPPSMPPLGPIN